MNKIIKYISFFCSLSSFLIYRFINYEIKIPDLCQHDARPVIYGEELCNDLYNQRILLTEDLVGKLIYLFSSKSVLHARYGNRKVILKTITTKDHLKEVEHQFNSKFSNKILNSRNSVDIIKLHILNSIRIRAGSALQSKLRLCPYGSNIENLFHRIGSSKFTVQDYLHLWTIVQCNPEPLILKMLKPPNWPVPWYYGSCGRLIIVEDGGLMLTQFFGAPWYIRANISYQLLESVLKFTFDDPEFGYYLTDMSPDNIAIANNGQVKFIDLENIILVDKNPSLHSKLMEEWKRNHTSKHFSCNDCIIFEADEICLHRTSDHNVYALCKEIFSNSSLFPGGFLHTPPAGISELNQLNELIDDCLVADTTPRFETANKLMSLLKLYL